MLIYLCIYIYIEPPLKGALLDIGGALEGATVALFAAPHEKGMIQETIDAIPPEQCLDLVGHKDVDLLTAYAIFKRSSLFIGNDSGLMHMAAAFHIAGFCVFPALTAWTPA